jgi:hypothetical protein
MIDKPSAPTSIVKSRELSTPTLVHVSWSPIESESMGDILGYKLKVRCAVTSEEWIDFNGYEEGLWSRTSHSVYNLKAGLGYFFSVVAYNFNGEGVWSDESYFLACNPPTPASAPTRLNSSVSSITVQWKTPFSDGGCPITGYSVHMDDGLSGDFVEVNESFDLSVRNNPGLHQLTITSGLG